MRVSNQSTSDSYLILRENLPKTQGLLGKLRQLKASGQWISASCMAILVQARAAAALGSRVMSRRQVTAILANDGKVQSLSVHKLVHSSPQLSLMWIRLFRQTVKQGVPPGARGSKPERTHAACRRQSNRNRSVRSLMVDLPR